MCSGNESKTVRLPFKWARCGPGARIRSCRKHLHFGLLESAGGLGGMHTGHLCRLASFPLELQHHVSFLFLLHECKAFSHFCALFFSRRIGTIPIFLHFTARETCMGFINLWAGKPYELFMGDTWSPEVTFYLHQRTEKRVLWFWYPFVLPPNEGVKGQDV